MELTLTKLPWYAQIGAFVALAAVGCGLFYYYYEEPARTDMASRQTQLTALRADITKGLNTAKKLPEFRQQVADLQGRLANLKAILPEEKDAADLLNRSLLTGFLPVQGLRGMGLYALEQIGPLRRAVMREGVAPRANQPRLMRGMGV